MNSEIEQFVKENYPKIVAEHALSPKNLGVMVNPHVKNGHKAANGDSVDFYLRFEGERVSHCTFTAQGSVMVFAAASVVTQMVVNMKLYHAISYIDVDAVSDELGGVNESDLLNLFLVVEALKKSLLDGVVLTRDPWKKLYSKPSGSI
jgi:NifU-like protein involved in Fe-S cluster formation